MNAVSLRAQKSKDNFPVKNVGFFRIHTNGYCEYHFRDRYTAKKNCSHKNIDGMTLVTFHHAVTGEEVHSILTNDTISNSLYRYLDKAIDPDIKFKIIALNFNYIGYRHSIQATIQIGKETEIINLCYCHEYDIYNPAYLEMLKRRFERTYEFENVNEITEFAPTYTYQHQQQHQIPTVWDLCTII